MGRSGKSRFGNPLGARKNGLGWRGVGSWERRSPPSGLTVPHVENRPACRITNDLVQLRVWEVIDNGMRIRISCDNCQHETIWTEGYMTKKLKKWRGHTMFRMAQSLRCGGCRSNYVRVWRG